MINPPPWLRTLAISCVRGNLHEFEGTRSQGLVEHFAQFSTLQIVCEAIARDRSIYERHKHEAIMRGTPFREHQREIMRHTKALTILLAEGTKGELPLDLESEIREVIERSQIRADFSGLP